MSDSPLSLPPGARPSSYHDFSGLASLRGEAAQGAAGAVRETAKQFEAYFIQQMMKTMREAIERDDLMANPNGEMFQDLMDKEIAVKMADRSALGLADMIERSLAQRQPLTAQEALAARGALPLQPAAPALSLGNGKTAPLTLPASGGLPLGPVKGEPTGGAQ
jgi:flagellar protein FlgJ